MTERERWPDERIDDLNATLRAMAPIVTLVAQHEVRITDNAKDLDQLGGALRRLEDKIDGLTAAGKWSPLAKAAVIAPTITTIGILITTLLPGGRFG